MYARVPSLLGQAAGSTGSVVGLGWGYPTPGLGPQLWNLCALAQEKAVVCLQEEEE